MYKICLFIMYISMILVYSKNCETITAVLSLEHFDHPKRDMFVNSNFPFPHFPMF